MTQTSLWARFCVALALIVATGLFLYARSGGEAHPARQQLESFPREVAGWQGQNLAIPPEVLEVLGEGEFLSRLYLRRHDEPFIDLFVAYFPSQRTGQTIHSPKNCLPGSGWQPMESSRLALQSSDRGSAVVNRYIIAKGSDRQLVLYWYQAHSRIVASEYWAKLHLVGDAIRLNRSDGALVRVVTPIATTETADAAQQRAVGFAQGVLPLLRPYIPD